MARTEPIKDCNDHVVVRLTLSRGWLSSVAAVGVSLRAAVCVPANHIRICRNQRSPLIAVAKGVGASPTAAVTRLLTGTPTGHPVGWSAGTPTTAIRDQGTIQYGRGLRSL